MVGNLPGCNSPVHNLEGAQCIVVILVKTKNNIAESYQMSSEYTFFPNYTNYVDHALYYLPGTILKTKILLQVVWMLHQS